MLITIQSHFSVAETVQKIKALLHTKAIKLFAEIDHAKEAKSANLVLRDEVLLIFGDPKVGTLLMQEKPSIGIDLPLKILIWKDDSDKTQVAYVDPIQLGKDHGIIEHQNILQKIKILLENLTNL